LIGSTAKAEDVAQSTTIAVSTKANNDPIRRKFVKNQSFVPAPG
jgi:hypothetical protein